jgi:hypothetical protein
MMTTVSQMTAWQHTRRAIRSISDTCASFDMQVSVRPPEIVPAIEMHRSSVITAILPDQSIYQPCLARYLALALSAKLAEPAAVLKQRRQHVCSG